MGRVSDKAAGWYPDPGGTNRQRYWDGDSWTEYYTPLAPERPKVHGASTATSDYPYLVASRTGAHHDLMAPPVRVDSRTGWPTAPAAAREGETQEFNGSGRRSSASMWALVAASTLVVMLVVGIGWWAFGPDPAPPDPTVTDTAVPTDGETVTADLGLNAPTSATVPAAGMWIGNLTLQQDTTVLVDATGAGSRDDLRVTIVPEGSDNPIAVNDDRGSNLGNITGNALDPLLGTRLPAGTYAVQVDERNGAEVDAEIVVTALRESLVPDASLRAEIADGGYWAGELDVTEGSYRIDVSGITTSANPNPDAVVVVIGDGDRQYYSDDRSADDRDPLLEQDLPTGTWVVLVFDYRVRPLTADISLERLT